MIEKVMVSLQEAIDIVLEHTPTLPSETVSISASLNRALAEDVYAKRDHPPWDNAAMDGYAVCWQDVCDVTPENPVQLNVAGEVRAGALPSSAVTPGNAIQIMTGAPTPKGADVIIPVENTERQNDTVLIKSLSSQGRNIRRKGEDISIGDLILNKGLEIEPAHIGIFATAAYHQVQVYQRPNVSILATGDELAEPGKNLTPEKIINSNSYSLSALVEETGAHCTPLPPAKDNKQDLEEKITRALQSDVVIIVGGVSMGKYDYVKDVLDALGCQIKFWRVAIRPGHPLAFGIIEDKRTGQSKLLFALPGNPVSCVVTFYQCVRPALRKMMGYQSLFLQQVEAQLTHAFSKKAGRIFLARALTEFRDGRCVTTLAPDQGSGVLTSFSRTNSLAVFPAEEESFEEGALVKVQLLPY